MDEHGADRSGNEVYEQDEMRRRRDGRVDTQLFPREDKRGLAAPKNIVNSGILIRIDRAS